MMNEKERSVDHVIKHYRYAVQAALETDLPEVVNDDQDWHTLLGLFLQDTLVRLSKMEEGEIEKEVSRYRYWSSPKLSRLGI